MAGIGISLGGGSEKSKTRSSSTSTTTGTNVTIGMDAASKKRLDDFMGLLMGRVSGGTGEDPRYSKEAAISDSQGMVASIFDRYRKDALPDIFSSQGRAGAYNNTSAQLMANDAFAQANTAAAGVVMDTIVKYAQLGQQEEGQDFETLLNIFGLQNKAYSKEIIDQTTTENGTSRTSGQSAKAGFSFGR